MTTSALIDGILSVLTPLATFVAALTAIYGINAWRREHIGKRRIELAEDTLAAFYEAADAISAIRHPLSYSSETEDVERGENESEAQFQARKNASVVFKRYNDRSELFNRLHAMRYRFMAIIGKDEAAPFNNLNKITHEITVAARMLARLWPRERFQTQEEYEQHLERINRSEAIFWEGLAEEDPIAPRVEQVLNEIEATCGEIIKNSGIKGVYMFGRQEPFPPWAKAKNQRASE